ncbi:MAG: WGR domain-containing protein [Pseudomonadota bacterium]
MQLSLFPKDIYLTRIDNEKLTARFYRMRIAQDLFGRTVLWREWGRIGSFGRLKFSSYDCEGTAVSDLAVIAQSKHKSGYLMYTE